MQTYEKSSLVSGVKHLPLIMLMVFFMCTFVRAEDKNLCASSEIMVATCVLNEKKSRTLSFCSSADHKKMHYRVGSKTKLEMDVSFSKKKPMSRWVDIGTYTTYFGFRSMDYAYVLGVPEERFGARAFLEVSKKDKPIMGRTCVTNSFGEKALLNEAMEEVDDRIVRGNHFLFPPKASVVR